MKMKGVIRSQIQMNIQSGKRLTERGGREGDELRDEAGGGARSKERVQERSEDGRQVGRG